LGLPLLTLYIYIYIYIYLEPISGDHVVAVINLKKKIIVVREIFVLDPNCDAFERFCARSLLTWGWALLCNFGLELFWNVLELMCLQQLTKTCFKTEFNGIVFIFLESLKILIITKNNKKTHIIMKLRAKHTRVKWLKCAIFNANNMNHIIDRRSDQF